MCAFGLLLRRNTVGIGSPQPLAQMEHLIHGFVAQTVFLMMMCLAGDECSGLMSAATVNLTNKTPE